MEGLLCSEMLTCWSKGVLLHAKGPGNAQWGAQGVGCSGTSMGHREAGQFLYQRMSMG